nr:zinc finger A20 and AN1 domain-containing stress-associated protein 1-like [Tanacetum cinerariifolium]
MSASSFMSAALAKVAMDKVFSFDKVDSSRSSSSSDAVTKPAVLKEVVKVKVTNRCFDSNKKVGVMVFKCRCGETFLGCIELNLELVNVVQVNKSCLPSM